VTLSNLTIKTTAAGAAGIAAAGATANCSSSDRSCPRRTVLKLPLLLAGGTALARAPRASAEQPSRWSPDRANRWYQAQGWLVGANYITSNAINQLEMFQPGTYDPRRIEYRAGLGTVSRAQQCAGLSP
jgi:hypothetical protein